MTAACVLSLSLCAKIRDYYRDSFTCFVFYSLCVMCLLLFVCCFVLNVVCCFEICVFLCVVSYCSTISTREKSICSSI
jgi:hypothetical protein